MHDGSKLKAVLSREYRQRLMSTLRSWHAEQDKELLLGVQYLIRMFDTDRLMGNVKWVSGTRILPDTQLIFTTKEKSMLSVEVINPGMLKDQETCFLGLNHEKLVTHCVFDQFLGAHPIDRKAKELFVRNLKRILYGSELDPDGDDYRYEIAFHKAKEYAMQRRIEERMKHFVTKKPLTELTPIPTREDKDIVNQFMPIIN